MHPATETPTAAGPKADSLKTTEPPKQAPPTPASKKSELAELPLESIELAGFFKVREQFSDVGELAESMKSDGQINPVTVRPLGPGKYQLVAGYRRWHAAKKAGLKTIKADVRVLTDKEAHLVALAENVQRRDLSPIEEAEALASAIGHGKWQQKELAKALGRSEAYVSNSLRLRQLPEPVQEMIAEGKITAGHAQHALLKTDDPKLQMEMARVIVKQDQNVREAERMANVQIQEQKKEQAWKEKVATSKFPVCPTDKKPPVYDRYGYYTPGTVRCASNHTWRLSDGKDPDAEARSARAREAAKYRSKSSKTLKAKPEPKYYEPVTFRLPVDDEDLEKGWLRWLAANMTKVSEVDLEDAWGSRTVLTISLGVKAPVNYTWENRMGSNRVVGILGVGSGTNDAKRVEAREQLEEFIVKWIPGGAKAIPKEGLHGGDTVTTSCEHCGGGVKGPSRATIKCPHCKKDTNLGTGRPDGRPVGLKKEVVLTHPDNIRGVTRIGNEKLERKKGYLYFLGKDGYLWQIPTRTNKKGKKERVGTEKVERRPGFMYFVDKGGYLATSKLIAGGTAVLTSPNKKGNAAWRKKHKGRA